MASQVFDSESGATGDAVVTLSGSRSALENMWGRVSLKSSGGVGVRVTCTGSNENSRLTNVFCENQTESAIAFGIGDKTSLDVAEVVMIGCDSVGNSALGSIHMQVGDGGTGNVLDITNIGGNSQDNNYGVVMAGGALVSRGLNFSELRYGGHFSAPTRRRQHILRWPRMSFGFWSLARSQSPMPR
jgi:hypothetical protein